MKIFSHLQTIFLSSVVVFGLIDTAKAAIAQQAYLKASNTDQYDHFGWSVATSGTTVVVGAFAEDSNATGVNGNQNDNSAVNSGAAYVFVRDTTTGAWSQQAYLKASNTEASDLFGASVAISGDTIVVGAIFEASNATGVNGNQNNNNALNSGAAYVFVRDTTTGAWSQQAYLKASNTETDDVFGASVAISGNTIVVASEKEDSSATGVNGNQNNNNAVDSGAAYVFVRDTTTGIWSQQAYLKASNTEAFDIFGLPVAIQRDIIVVGAGEEDSDAKGVNGNQNNNNAVDSGAAYVFVRNGGVWSQQAYLKASNTEAGDGFGNSVAISGTTIVVGADGEDSSATGVNGNQNDNTAQISGAAYVFVPHTGTPWIQQAYLKASNTGAYDHFGFPLAISGNTIVIGSLYEDSDATGVNGNQNNNNAVDSGAAYVFTRNNFVWSQQAYLKASNTNAGDGFGSVAISGTTIVVGADGEDSSATGVNGNQNDNTAQISGAAYIFVP